MQLWTWAVQGEPSAGPCRSGRTAAPATSAPAASLQAPSQVSPSAMQPLGVCYLADRARAKRPSLVSVEGGCGWAAVPAGGEARARGPSGTGHPQSVLANGGGAELRRSNSGRAGPNGLDPGGHGGHHKRDNGTPHQVCLISLCVGGFVCMCCHVQNWAMDADYCL